MDYIFALWDGGRRTDATSRQTEAARSTRSFSRNCPGAAEIAGKPLAVGSAIPGVLAKKVRVMI
jgi:hypothetical protein